MDKEWETEIWRVLRDYFATKDMVTMTQKESFEYFIHHRLTKIVEEEPVLNIPITPTLTYRVLFGQVFVDKPYIIDENREIRYITPNEARLRDLTYSSVVSMNIRTSMIENEQESDVQQFFKIHIARIPIMIGTSKCNLYGKTLKERTLLGECPLDTGGYFIMKGKERVLIAQERMNYNIVYVFQQKANTKYEYTAEIRSMSEETGHSVLVQMKMNYGIHRKIMVQLPYLSHDIPLGYIWRAYGLSIDEIVRMCSTSLDVLSDGVDEKFVIECVKDGIIRDAQMIESVDHALHQISQFSTHIVSKERRLFYVKQILYNEIFPHMGISSTPIQKAFFLGHMLQKVVGTCIGVRPEDDRDHLSNKRFECAGHLLSELFRTLYKRFVRSLEPQLLKRPDILVVMARVNTITQGLKHCFATGNWGIPKSSYIRTGVSQILSRLTFNATLSHLRRILIPIGKEGKNTKIRQIHPSQIFFVCPSECFDPNTPILMWDGSIKLAQDIVVGDMLIDENGNATRVRKTIAGITQMYEILPIQKNFMNHTVTSNHILTLKITNSKSVRIHRGIFVAQWFDKKDLCFRSKGGFLSKDDAQKCLSTIPDDNIIDISIDQYFRLSDYVKKHLVLFKCEGIHWGKQDIELDPYILGMWLGNRNTFYNDDIAKNDSEKYGLKKKLIKYNLIKNKHIPKEYLVNDRQTRLKILAGLIDSCGSVRANGHEICIYSNTRILEDALLVAQSLGFPCYLQTTKEKQSTSTVLSIIGECINDIPTLLSRKKIFDHSQKETCSPFLHSLFTIEQKGFGQYVGWQLEGNGRFLGKDATILHNTPEGHSAGIVKNFAMSTEVSQRCETSYIRMIIENMKGFIHVFSMELTRQTWFKVFLNGNWIGVHKEIEFYTQLREYKEQGRLPSQVSVALFEFEREIHICCDEGRMLRPVFVVSKLPSLEQMKQLSFVDMVNKGMIVYVDPNEVEHAVIAMYRHELNNPCIVHDYLELHPCLMMGICASLLPFMDHTQSPRITYQASMGKQALGVYASTNNIRTDTSVHILCNPEKPVVRTRIGTMFGYDERPSGNNLIVAIASYTGFNQEDSIIFNKSSLERGVFRSYSYRTIVVEERKKTTSSMETIELPNSDLQTRSYNYSKLGPDGIILPGTYVGPGDVIVGKTTLKIQKNNPDEQVDSSVILRLGEEGYVDRVFVTKSPDGYRLVKIKIRTLKIPELGDKAASRAAQKGIIGMIFPQEDMPFTMNGITPDIIINPHCIPSRMTINQLIECIAAKASVIQGRFCYSTAFSHESRNIIPVWESALHACHFQKHGNEMMINGMTGEPLKSLIFIGPTYYQRLKHLVSNKIHARNHGNVQALTKQPNEGRSRDGGLRFGEMERDCVSASASISLKMGVGIKIKDMEKLGWSVLGWDSVHQVMVPSEQIAFLNKGERECVKVILEDGRELVCTPEHKLLTAENEWVKANTLIKNDSRLKCSVSYPTIDILSEMGECQSWSLQVGSILLSTSTVSNFLQTLAFSRLMGMFIADTTTISLRGNTISGSISVGHESDVANVVDDLAFFCDRKVIKTSYTNDDRGYRVLVPTNFLLDVVTNIPEIMVGKRVLQPFTLPSFILQDHCPRPLIREFLAAFMGGDGHIHVFGQKRGTLKFNSLDVSKSRICTHFPSLVTMMENVKRLFQKCGVSQITIQSLKEKNKKKTEIGYECILHIGTNEALTYHSNIGFRYCSHKSMRFEAFVAHKRLCSNILRQRLWIVNRVDDILNFKKRYANGAIKINTSKAIQQAVDELQQQETLLHPQVVPTPHDLSDHLLKGTQLKSSKFESDGEFIERIGIMSWFRDDQVKIGLPTMNLKVIDVRPCGVETVYDIQVDKTESFLANGVVAHNCIITHGTSRFLVERLYDMSDKFSVPVCVQCGHIPNSLQMCNLCKHHSVTRVPLPYACKLLFQQLTAMGIKIHLLPKSQAPQLLQN